MPEDRQNWAGPIEQLNKEFNELQEKKIEQLKKENTSYKKVQEEGTPAVSFVKLREGMRLQVSCVTYEVVDVLADEQRKILSAGDVVLRPITEC